MTTDLFKQEEVQQYGLTVEQAESIVVALPQILSERDVLSKQYTEVIELDINEPATSKTAKDLRLKIRDNRTKGIEAWHKVNKEYFLRGGQFVDAIKRREIAENVRMEDKLEEMEKYFENLEKEKKEQLQIDRVKELSIYFADAEQMDFRNMPEEVYQAFLSSKKEQYEKAEELRKAEEEKEKIYVQRLNELLKLNYFNRVEDGFTLSKDTTEEQYQNRLKTLLKRESDYKEEQIQLKLRKDRDAVRMSELKEYLRFIVDIQAVLDMDNKKYSAELKTLVEAKKQYDKAEEKKLEEQRQQEEENKRLRKEKEEAEAKRLESERKLKEQEEAELKKGDIEKFDDLKKDLESLKTKYKMKGDNSKKLYENVIGLLEKTVQYINSNI